MNFVSSVNGISTVDGLSGGLSSPTDVRLFGTLRGLADVILVGAGTARAERYRGARTSAGLRDKRSARGQAEVPPIAVVTSRADLAPDSQLFTDTAVAPIILTTEAAPERQRTRLLEAGAEVLIVGERRANIHLILEALQRRGLNRVLCEGGPSFFGQLIEGDHVDELCITLAPCLVGGTDHLSVGHDTDTLPMNLASVIVDNNELFLRYVRDRTAGDRRERSSSRKLGSNEKQVGSVSTREDHGLIRPSATSE